MSEQISHRGREARSATLAADTRATTTIATTTIAMTGAMTEFRNQIGSGATSYDKQLSALTPLASVTIETSMVEDLSGSLHHLFDAVCDKTLPIYFGPLLGRLYLEGL